LVVFATPYSLIAASLIPTSRNQRKKTSLRSPGRTKQLSNRKCHFQHKIKSNLSLKRCEHVHDLEYFSIWLSFKVASRLQSRFSGDQLCSGPGRRTLRLFCSSNANVGIAICSSSTAGDPGAFCIVDSMFIIPKFTTLVFPDESDTRPPLRLKAQALRGRDLALRGNTRQLDL
jgi:hypothetical protein